MSTSAVWYGLHSTAGSVISRCVRIIALQLANTNVHRHRPGSSTLMNASGYR
jgi:hypothetical protein